jgi:hypothetical protein
MGLDNVQRLARLGRRERTTFFGGEREKTGSVSRDTPDHLSCLLGIYKSAAYPVFRPDRRREVSA